MSRYWIMLAIAGAVLALIFWPSDRASKNEARKSTPIAKGTVSAQGNGHLNEAMENQAARKGAPRLSEDAPNVILDARPRLPEEPAHTYNARLRLVEHWNECRDAVNLTEEQERVILLALYDAQQQDASIMYGRGLELTEDELMFTARQIDNTQRRKIERALTGEQRWLWRRALDCRLLPIFAAHGALRLPGDTPRDLYWFTPTYRSDDEPLPLGPPPPFETAPTESAP